MDIRNENYERSLRELEVGDIVWAWLGCTQFSSLKTPADHLVVITRKPINGNYAFDIKPLFSSEESSLTFGYDWKKVGHIEGID